MDKAVCILISRANRDLFVYPFGVFRGYGGYVGIDPYKRLPGDAPIDVICSVILELLDASRSVQYHIRDIDRYRLDNEDPESASVRASAFRTIRSTADLAKRYRQIEISTSGKLQSYKICEMGYDSEQDTLFPILRMRVKKQNGAAALHASLAELLSSS